MLIPTSIGNCGTFGISVRRQYRSSSLRVMSTPTYIYIVTKKYTGPASEVLSHPAISGLIVGAVLLVLCRSFSTLYHVFQILLISAGAPSPCTPHPHGGPTGIRCMRAQSPGDQHAHEHCHCRRITLLVTLHAHAWGQIDVDRHLAVEGIHSSWTSKSDKCLQGDGVAGRSSFRPKQ